MIKKEESEAQNIVNVLFALMHIKYDYAVRLDSYEGKDSYWKEYLKEQYEEASIACDIMQDIVFRKIKNGEIVAINNKEDESYE